MANIPQIDPELLLRAYSSPSLGQALESGMAGYEKGVDIGSKLASQKALRKKQEQDLLQQIEQLKLQQKQQSLKEKESAAGMITPELSKKVKQEMTPEVFKTLYPTVEPTKAPAGYEFNPDSSLKPIKGSAEDVKRKKEEEAAKQAYDQGISKAKVARAFIESTIPKVSRWTAGIGSKLQIFPGSAARNLQSDIQEIKSRIGLDALMAAKATSPTGASGFGQLSDKEMEILQAQVANLDTVQSPEQLKEKLNTVLIHYDNVLALLQGKNPYTDKNPAPSASADLSSMSTEDLLKKLAGR